MAMSPEALLISSVIRNGEYHVAMKLGVTSNMFHAYEDEWAWIEKYYLRHQRTPGRVSFKAEFGDFRIHSTDDTEHHVEGVRSSHARHMLASVMRECTDYISTGDIDKAVSYMTLEMSKVSAAMGVVADRSLVDDWEDTYDIAVQRKERFEQHGTAGVPTGFSVVDTKTGGIQPGQYWVVAGRLGEKKSWTLNAMAISALMGGYNVHFTALEQSYYEVSMRTHHLLSGRLGQKIFESQALMSGQMPDMKAYRSFLRGLRSHIKANMTISDRRGIGVAEFSAQLERHRPDVWFLDQITLTATPGDGGWQDIANVSTQINTLAERYGVGVVVAAQLNRNAVAGKDPSDPENIGGSDKIGQDGGIVITTRQLSNSVNSFKLAKNRYGPHGFIWYCHFDSQQGVFEEVDKDRALDLVDQDRVRTGADR
jgi:replicative DNA helicase